MASPDLVTRTAPSGCKLGDGYQTVIAFQNAPGLEIWEETVKPPSVEGGGGIETTTMLNTAYRTKDTKHLKTLGNSTVVAAYDPDVLSTILAQVNVNQGITVKFPDGSTLTFWGFLDKFEPQEMKEGEMPKANLEIIPSNWDPSACAEAGPVFAPAAGT